MNNAKTDTIKINLNHYYFVEIDEDQNVSLFNKSKDGVTKKIVTTKSNGWYGLINFNKKNRLTFNGK